MVSYQIVAVAALVAMGLVVHSTVQLNRWRRAMQTPKKMFNTRDLDVLRRPADFESDEVLLVRIHWISCIALMVLLLALAAVVPPEVLEKLQAQRT